MTTRKAVATRLTAGVALGLGIALLAGCATPGALHRYAIAPDRTEVVHDDSADGQVTVPSFVAAGETVTGFAYDPYTDHFFLRLAPGNAMRVVDRPARAIKREMTLEQTPATGGGDLAVRPRTGHLYLVHPTDPAIIQLNRFGKFLRVLPLSDMAGPPRGIAHDAGRDVLWVLASGSGVGVNRYDLAGGPLGGITLERAVGDALAFDSDRREVLAPLADGSGIGVFDDQGRLQRTLPGATPLLDVGPRSFVRVF